MKKITLKYYGYRDPEPMLENALDFIRTKAQIKHVQLDVKNKAVTFQADPYDVEALRTTLRKKYGVTLITNLPRTHVFFVNFLAEEGFYDEFTKLSERSVGAFLNFPSRADWDLEDYFSCAFVFKDARHFAINKRYRIAATEFLTKNNLQDEKMF